MKFLVDTNVLSELRKGGRCNPAVARWADAADPQDMAISALVVGEIRQGIERIRARDRAQAVALDRWLENVRATFDSRILAVDEQVAELWGRMNVSNPLPLTDGLMAATARVHGLTLVTRNTRDFVAAGLTVLNPFTAAP